METKKRPTRPWRVAAELVDQAGSLLQRRDEAETRRVEVKDTDMVDDGRRGGERRA
jgi:hypothetical protein